MGRRVSEKVIHVGVAWLYRNSRRTDTTKVHAVDRPDGVSAERLPDGRIGWNKPWLRICDGGLADERRTGWASNVTCSGCRRKLAEDPLINRRKT